MFMNKILLAGCLLANGSLAQAGEAVIVPAIVEPWWQVSGDPDLGPWTTEAQQPVDFGVWQAADGTWQLWSCIRKTNCGGNTRLFYLFRTQRYGQNSQTSVYHSKDPMDFGVEDDRCLVCRLPIAAPEIVLDKGQWYMAVLLPSLKGIQIARLDWRVDPDWVRPGTIRGKSVFDFDDPTQRQLWRCVEGQVEPVFTTSTRSDFSAPSRYFIGTAESARRPGRPDDAQTGVIESPRFRVDADEYFALVSGGGDRETTHVAVVESETGEELVRLTGTGNSNRLEPAAVDLRAHRGKQAFIRVVDRATGSWGHINFGGLYADTGQ